MLAKHILLLVEDDKDVRELYQELLEDEGYTIETSVEGKDALQKILERDYELILLDLMLPGIDGIGILKRIAEGTTERTKTPIILLTNVTNDDILQEALNLGVKAFIIKSAVTPDQVINTVRQYLPKES